MNTTFTDNEIIRLKNIINSKPRTTNDVYINNFLDSYLNLSLEELKFVLINERDEKKHNFKLTCIKKKFKLTWEC